MFRNSLIFYLILKSIYMRYLSSCCLIMLALLQPKSPVNDASDVNSAASPADWKIGVQMWTFHFVSFVKALDKADSAGVHYIEAFPGQTLGGDLTGTFGPGMPDTTRAKVKQLLE